MKKIIDRMLFEMTTFKFYAARKGLPFYRLAEMVGMTDHGLRKSIKEETLKVTTLFELAEILNVHYSELIEEPESSISKNPFEEMLRSAVEKILDSQVVQRSDCE